MYCQMKLLEIILHYWPHCLVNQILEIDAAILSVIGYPAFSVGDARYLSSSLSHSHSPLRLLSLSSNPYLLCRRVPTTIDLPPVKQGWQDGQENKSLLAVDISFH